MIKEPIASITPIPAIEELRSLFNGRLITPDDPRYDKARTIFYGGYDRYPAAIIRAQDAADVSRVISYAYETGVELAVRSGGHSNAGHSVSEGGIILDLCDMKGLEIDVEGRTAWAETGLTAGEYTEAVGEYGLATGFGDTGSVGIGGITLGGGIGFLVRKYGMTIDDVLAAEIVTADGHIHHVDADHHPDLFWAIRGGGGNFGVVTRFQFRLHEVDQIYGGILILPATAETVAGFVAAADAAPEELSTIANVMVAPPMPFLPAELPDKRVLFAFIAYAGEVAQGEAAVAPFRALATPLADMLRPMRYQEFYAGEEEYHPTAVGRTLFMDAIDHDTARLIVEQLAASTASMAVVQIRVLGGAMARVHADATAFAHRQRPIMVNVAAFYEGEDDKPIHAAWVNKLAAMLRQDNNDSYVNFLSDEGEAGVRGAYPAATWERLAAVKRRYDPTNLFHLNHNIPPAAEERNGQGPLQ